MFRYRNPNKPTQFMFATFWGAVFAMTKVSVFLHHYSFSPKEKLEARVAVLSPLAASCSPKEVAILATAMEELFVHHGIDAMDELLIIQVDTYHSLLKHTVWMV